MDRFDQHALVVHLIRVGSLDVLLRNTPQDSASRSSQGLRAQSASCRGEKGMRPLSLPEKSGFWGRGECAWAEP